MNTISYAPQHNVPSLAEGLHNCTELAALKKGDASCSDDTGTYKICCTTNTEDDHTGEFNCFDGDPSDSTKYYGDGTTVADQDYTCIRDTDSVSNNWDDPNVFGAGGGAPLCNSSAPAAEAAAQSSDPIPLRTQSFSSNADSTTPSPTSKPSSTPGSAPSEQPSPSHSLGPSSSPSSTPSADPSSKPSSSSSSVPSSEASASPSSMPSILPSLFPTVHPSNIPSDVPSKEPSSSPSSSPSSGPSPFPSLMPSSSPSATTVGGLVCGFCTRAQTGCTTGSCNIQCPDDFPSGYYPDLTDHTAYCKCTGTNAPSRYEHCHHGLKWDILGWNAAGTQTSFFYLNPYGQGTLWATNGGICSWPSYLQDDRPTLSEAEALALCTTASSSNSQSTTVCTAANADEKCTDDEDCIIAPGSNEGNCISSAVCTDTKDDLCDEAWSAVSGSGDGSAKCCPSTSSCIKSAIGVKATSTCSTSCGSSCLGATTKNKRDLPTTFCRFGTRIGKFITTSYQGPL